MDDSDGIDYGTFGVVSAGNGLLRCLVCDGKFAARTWFVNPSQFTLRCSGLGHADAVAEFFNSPRPIPHSKTTRDWVCEWFLPRINALDSPSDKQEILALLFLYAFSCWPEGLSSFRLAVTRLERAKKKDPIVALMLAAWKNLAKSRAGEQRLSMEIRDLRTASDICILHRHDWKKYSSEVFDAGHVHLVEKLVRPFWRGTSAL
jgi:hypothetical protein